MDIFEDQAILLRIRPSGERDKLVTFLSKNHGMITAIAKGAVGSRRFASALESLQVSHLVWAEKSTSNIARIDSAQVHKNFPSLQQDYEKLTRITPLIKQILKVLPHQEPASEFYSLLANALFCIDEVSLEDFNEATLAIFHLKFLYLLGISPRLNHCTQCESLRGSSHSSHFSPKLGGYICDSCSQTAISKSIPTSLLIEMGEALELPYNKIAAANFSEAFGKTVPKLVANLMEFHLP